jgi:hypothetical protein
VLHGWEKLFRNWIKGKKTWGSCKFSLEASKEIGMSEIPKKGPQNE